MHRAELDRWLSDLDDALDDAREANRPLGPIVDEARAQLASEVSAEDPADARWFALELGDLARRYRVTF